MRECGGVWVRWRVWGSVGEVESAGKVTRVGEGVRVG